MTNSPLGPVHLPDELTIRILAHLSPEDVLLNFAPCSRQLRAISYDNSLWIPFCTTSLNICSTGGSQFIANRWIKGVPADELGAVARFWNRFLREWIPRLGWWADIHGSAGSVYRVSADMTAGVIRQHMLVLGNHLVPVHCDHLELCVFSPNHSLEAINGEARFDASHGAMFASVGVDSPSRVMARRIVFGENDTPMHSSVYPSSTLIPAFDAKAESEKMVAWNVPVMRIGQLGLLARLRSPEFHGVLNGDKAPSTIYSGWYTADYSSKGCQLFYIRIVDPAVDVIIPESSHDILPDNHLARTSRRIEAVKITGDDHIWKGSRTFVGFLDAPTACIGPAGIPVKSTRPLRAPWPTDQSSTLPRPLQNLYTAPSGMTMPGYGKSSFHGTTNWLPTTVHVASPEEIQMTYSHYVFTYRRFHVEQLSETTS